MRIYSFIRKGLELIPIEVEISLMAGTNQLQIMGLPDMAIKESALRIKSALKSQGFRWPAGQQILVNLRPSHWRKSSRGLELAIACGYLWQSAQAQVPEELTEEAYVYGELSLNGQVHIPDDLNSLFNHPEQKPILTGYSPRPHNHPLLSIKSLAQVNLPSPILPRTLPEELLEDVPLPDLNFPKSAARLLAVVASGEHSTLLAGPAGSGKTTLAKALHSLLGKPGPQLQREIQRVRRWFNEDFLSRPLVCPHHSVTTMSMCGGGYPVFPGEITRAHGGLLVLDEFLEFNNQVKEALREPLESGEIVISRRGHTQVLPARFLLLASTNLCHCGRLVPNKNVNCRFSLTKCRSYLERLSGPLLDRFDVLAFSNGWVNSKKMMFSETEAVHLSTIKELVDKTRKFQKSRSQDSHPSPNGRTDGETISKTLDKFTRENLLPATGGSQRRFRALMRVARTLADLDQSSKITPKHIDEASDWAWQNFEQLHRIFA